MCRRISNHTLAIRMVQMSCNFVGMPQSTKLSMRSMRFFNFILEVEIWIKKTNNFCSFLGPVFEPSVAQRRPNISRLLRQNSKIASMRPQIYPLGACMPNLSSFGLSACSGPRAWFEKGPHSLYFEEACRKYLDTGRVSF